jgi:hypothetical protein
MKTAAAPMRSTVGGPALTASTAAPTTITQTRNDSNVGRTR